MPSLVEMSAPWWTYIFRGVMSYAGLLILLRLAGKRAFGEMSAFDVIVLVLVGGVLRTAIIGDDKGFAGPFIGVASILAADKLLAWICTRSAAFNRITEGYPSLLISAGHRHRDELLSQNIPEAALDRALHAAGIESDDLVAVARLEPNGKITVVQHRHRE
jgi:uncharacterized membrane protein YcaP (DUF421 family)